MKRIVHVALAILVLATPLFVLAQSAKEVNAEANTQMAEDDKRLNAAYEKLIKSIRSDRDANRAEFVIAHLRESQRAWLKYRDAQTGLVGVYNEIGSASARNAGLAQYNHELVEARIKDFEAVPNPF